jgi:hypothetical protein
VTEVRVDAEDLAVIITAALRLPVMQRSRPALARTWALLAAADHDAALVALVGVERRAVGRMLRDLGRGTVRQGDIDG